MSCNGLNLEEISGLEIAMMKRKLEENLPGKMYFWGKIFGTTQDYLIVHNIDPYAAFPEKKYYFWWADEWHSPKHKLHHEINSSLPSLITYSTPPEFVLKALPSISSEYMEKADKLKSSFTGDPSLFAFDGEGEIENPEDEVIFHRSRVHFMSTFESESRLVDWISIYMVICCCCLIAYVHFYHIDTILWDIRDIHIHIVYD